MGSITTYEDLCPICGNRRLVSDYYYRTGEEFDVCEACGFSLSITHLFDSGKIVREDGEAYPMDGSLVCLPMGKTSQMEDTKAMPVTQDMTEEHLRGMLGGGATMLVRKDGPGKSPVLYAYDDFRIEPTEAGINQFIVEKSIIQVKCHCTRPDGLTIDLHPITTQEIAQLQLSEKEPPVANRDYYVSAVDRSSNRTAVCLKQKDVEKAGTMKIIEGTNLIHEAGAASHLQFSFLEP